MSTQVSIWAAVVGLFIAAIVVRFTLNATKYLHRHNSHGAPLFRMGTEREEFFVPGDPDDDEEDMLNEEE